jgi:hypothetical protein
MGLPKGKTNNPNGRPKGVPNKSTAAIKNAFQCFVEDNLPKLQSMFDEIERPQDKLAFIKELSEYVLPKLSRTEATVEVTKPVDLSNASQETLDKLYAELNSSDDTEGEA